MEQFTALTAKVIPLPIKDVNTDMIIPAQYLNNVSRAGYGENLFAQLRAADPAFVFNRPEFRDARILAADSNFGCGSSREHAVWALMGWGIKAIIAPSFADIFFNNSAKNGLLCITQPKSAVDRLLQTAEGGDFSLSIDLERQSLKLPDGSEREFDCDPFRKHCLLNGLDDIDYIMSHKQEVDRYRREHEQRRFFSTKAGE